MRRVVILTAVLLGVAGVSAQEEWVYIYDSGYGRHDHARGVAQGPDGHLYVAAEVSEPVYYTRFAVISLDTAGFERWMYVTGLYGRAYGVAFDCSGDLYAVGEDVGAVVVSLSPQGQERWVYRFDTSRYYSDMREVAVAGGNVYVAGHATDRRALSGLAVACLDTQGSFRWLHILRGYFGNTDYAKPFACGPDGNIYVGGCTSDTISGMQHFTILSLTPDGTERWVYRLGSGWRYGAAALCCDPEANVYATGALSDTFVVVSVDSGGRERWVARETPHREFGGGISVVLGADGRVYAAGDVGGSQPTDYVLRLACYTTLGERLWSRSYCPADSQMFVMEMSAGPGGLWYVAGRAWGFFPVVCFDSVQTEPRWVYRRGVYSDGIAYDTEVGIDGRLYVAGTYLGYLTQYDVIVVCLRDTAAPGVAEEKTRGAGGKRPNVLFDPGFFPFAGQILDIQGRDVTERQERLSPGVYFIGEGSRGQGFKGPSARKVVIQR